MNNGFQDLDKLKGLFVLTISGLLLHLLFACSGTIQCNALFILNGDMSTFRLLKKMAEFASESDAEFLGILSLILAVALALVGLSAVIAALPVLLTKQYKRSYLAAAMVALPISTVCQAAFYLIIKSAYQEMLGDVIKLSGIGVLYFLESAATWILTIVFLIGLKLLTAKKQSTKNEGELT